MRSVMRKNLFSIAFKRKSVKLITEHNYSYKDAAVEMGVHTSTIGRWVAKYRAGKLSVAPKTTEQVYIQELEEKNVKLQGRFEALEKALLVLLDK